MARALKVFKTHMGFYDLIVAAPSMKAAAAAWDSDTKLFTQGFAAPTDDKGEVRAALAQPGVVLRRVHGQGSDFQLQPEAVEAPKVSAGKKAQAAKAAAAKKVRAAAEKKEQVAAAKKAKTDAAAELKEIERQEAELRAKRQSLQKKFHLRAVK